MHEDPGIATLIDLHGQIIDQGGGYWIKMPKKFRYAGRRVVHDHQHRHASDQGIPYEFQDAHQLLADFFAEVLSDENRALLKLIRETEPQSISSLAELTGRKPSNLSRTLKTLSNYGLVEMRRENRRVRPVAKATEFRILA